jgi:hypothetical protein
MQPAAAPIGSPHAHSAFRDWLWHEMMMGPPAEYVRVLGNGQREVRYHLSDQDTEYQEWEADIINRDIDDWQLLASLCPETPRISLLVDAFDRSRLRDSFVEYCTPREVQWLRYAASGFRRDQVTIKVLRPQAIIMRQAEWAKWQYYLAECQSLSNHVVISQEHDETSSYRNIRMPGQTWRDY